MNIVTCDSERHGAAVLAIFNEAIAFSTGLYEYRPRTAEAIAEWFAAKAQRNCPVLGLEDARGELLGFATFGPFRPQPAFKYTMEHSVYVDKRHRRRGAGHRLLQAIIRAAQERDCHSLIGVIDSDNAASIALHESLGFTQCGAIRHAGYKFGRWLDASLYQLLFSTPEEPVDE